MQLEFKIADITQFLEPSKSMSRLHKYLKTNINAAACAPSSTTLCFQIAHPSLIVLAWKQLVRITLEPKLKLKGFGFVF